MSKTVTVDGMVYEIGKLYKSQYGEVVRLIGVDMGNFNCVEFNGCKRSFPQLKALTEEDAGAITPAPVELIHGKTYMFTASNVRSCGIYNGAGERFMVGICDSYVLASDCENIIPLVPEVK